MYTALSTRTLTFYSRINRNTLQVIKSNRMIINKYAFTEKKECFCWCSFEEKKSLFVSLYFRKCATQFIGRNKDHSSEQQTKPRKQKSVGWNDVLLNCSKSEKNTHKNHVFTSMDFKNRILRRPKNELNLCGEKSVGWSHQFFVKIEIPILKKFKTTSAAVGIKSVMKWRMEGKRKPRR